MWKIAKQTAVAAPIIGILIVSAYLWSKVQNASGACVRGSTEPNLQKTVEALDSTVELGLTLAVSLVGLGSALLLGLRPELHLTAVTRVALLISVLCFAQSALYGVWWRLGVAEGWLNDCLNIIAEPVLASRYEADFRFFIAGLGFLMLMLLSSAVTGPGKPLESDGRA